MGWWLLLKALLTVLAKKREDLGITIDVEVLLRASIGAATYTTDAYFATLAQVNRRRQRVICRKPRNCVTRTIRELLRNTRNKDFGEIAYYVASKTS